MTLSSIRSALAGLRHDYFGRIYAGMLRAFFDDSGSGGDSPWYVLAGYLGTVEAWDSFDERWRRVLDGPPKIEYLKSSQAASLKGEWAGMARDERNHRIDALIDVIGKHARNSIYIRVKQQDYNEIIKPYVPARWDDAYYYLFIGCLTSCTSLERYTGNGSPIEFFFDSNEALEKSSQKLYGQLTGISTFKSKIDNIFYRDEKLFLPLQAADLLAWQIRRRFSIQEEPRPQFERAINCPSGITYNYTMSRDELEQIGKTMDENAMMTWALMGRLERNRPYRRPR